jgi:flagellar basal-body rod protein FlgC
MTIGSNISSIQANQELLNSSAHNIANANTKNFERIETNISENKVNQPEAINTNIENNNIYSNTDLTKEITNQIISYHAVGANAVALKTQDELEGTILNIKA